MKCFLSRQITTQAVNEINKITLELEDVSRAFSANVLDATKAFSLTLFDRAEVRGLAAEDLAVAARSAKVAAVAFIRS